MASVTETRATLDDLYKVEGKAELIDGRIEQEMPSGFLHGRISSTILVNLWLYTKKLGVGVALGDSVGYTVSELPSGRESFSPDVAYYSGSLPADPQQFIQGTPTLAIEVRSANDYGRAAEAKLAAKREDYFAAGTLVVWDVDPEAECVHVYRAGAPTQPQTFRRGETADAEPAVPGWLMTIDEIFAV